MSSTACILTTEKGIWYNFYPDLSVCHQIKVGGSQKIAHSYTYFIQFSLKSSVPTLPPQADYEIQETDQTDPKGLFLMNNFN